jgi:fatty-acyl-CoA synthase
VNIPVALAHEAIAAGRPDQECIVWRDRRLSYRDITDRSRRLAYVLGAHGLGCRVERDRLARWESGQDHLAIYLHNCNEYLESMLGAFKARVAPFNVNFRYVARELRQLLEDAEAAGIVFGSSFAPILTEVMAQGTRPRLLLQVDDGSRHPLAPGAMWYEDALALARPDPPRGVSPDDLYILYTGGTTGRPKGVLWRQGDAFIECFGGSRAPTIAGALAELPDSRPRRALPAAPFMHGTGQWLSFSTWNAGGTVVIQGHPQCFDPVDIWSTVERERIDYLLIVGDAFARPLLDELDAGHYDTSSLSVLLSGGAPLSARLKREFHARLPTVMIIDGLGSSEAGGQLAMISTGDEAGLTIFPPRRGSHVLSADLDRELAPGDPRLGWLAKSGRVALGYLGDPCQTATTYPVIEGRRYAVPGDRAHILRDGSIAVLGRDSSTINSGGEKIFAEEVEAAIKQHPAVYDCVVTSRPSERWGREVVAVVRLRDGQCTSESDLRAAARLRLASYKVPKAFVFVTDIERLASGKPDYRWAQVVAAS